MDYEVSINFKVEQSDLFRLSAILYRDDKYDLSKKTTLTKIVESVFLDENSYKTVYEVIKIISNKYALMVEEGELLLVLKDTKKFIAYENKFKLDSRRIDCLINDLKDKHIDDYIEEYLQKVDSKNFNEDSELIKKFIYNMFVANLSTYRMLINTNYSEIKVDSQNYDKHDVEIINGFLNDEKVQKERIIFKIASLSLEYCMFAMKVGSYKDNLLKNKIFYLDTNVLYRAIGLNGVERKELTLIFLERCKNFGIKFKVFRETDEEFQETIEYHSQKFVNTKTNIYIHRDIYKDYSSDELYQFFLDWANGRSSVSKNEFKSFVFSEYKILLERFNINLDYDNYGKFLERHEIDIDLIKERIGNEKRLKNNGLRLDLILNYDASMISNIIGLRLKFNHRTDNLFSNRYFLISTDQNLIRAIPAVTSYKHSLVMLPSIWMVVILRYIGRTEDDFKSFTSFISLRNNENAVSSEETIRFILSGIAQVSNDLDTQRYYAHEYINSDILDIIKNNLHDNEEIMTKVVQHMERDLGAKNNRLLDENKTLVCSNQSKDIMIEEQDATIKKLRQRNEQYAQKEIEHWSRWGYLGIIIVFISVAWIALHWIYLDKSFNIYALVSKYIALMPETSKNFFYMCDYASSIAFMTIGGKLAINRLYKNSKRYKQELERIRAAIDKENTEQSVKAEV